MKKKRGILVSIGIVFLLNASSGAIRKRIMIWIIGIGTFCSVRGWANGYMGEMMCRRRETRRQTENTNINLRYLEKQVCSTYKMSMACCPGLPPAISLKLVSDQRELNSMKWNPNDHLLRPARRRSAESRSAASLTCSFFRVMVNG